MPVDNGNKPPPPPVAAAVPSSTNISNIQLPNNVNNKKQSPVKLGLNNSNPGINSVDNKPPVGPNVNKDSAAVKTLQTGNFSDTANQRRSAETLSTNRTSFGETNRKSAADNGVQLRPSSVNASSSSVNSDTKQLQQQKLLDSVQREVDRSVDDSLR